MKEEMKTFGNMVWAAVTKFIRDLFFMLLLMASVILGVVVLVLTANTVCGTAANEAFVCVFTLDPQAIPSWVK